MFGEMHQNTFPNSLVLFEQGLFYRKTKDVNLTEMTSQHDQDLIKELDKIDWGKYLEYGTIRVTVREGKKTLTTIERTYPD